MTILEVDIRLAVERDADLRPGELDPQPVPDVPRHRRVHVLQRVAAPVRGVVERDVVLERIGARDVVVIAVLPAPHHAARLIFPALERLELDFDEPVLDRAPAQHAPPEGARARLLQHVRSAWRAWILAHGPSGRAPAGDALLPNRR